MSNKISNKILELPFVALRDIVIFPNSSVHFDINRPQSIKAVQKAMAEDQRLFIALQNDSKIEDPDLEDLYSMGTIITIKQIINLPGEVLRVLASGVSRGQLLSMYKSSSGVSVDVSPQMDRTKPDSTNAQALLRTLINAYKSYSAADQHVSNDVSNVISEFDDPDMLCDIIGANVVTKLSDKQKLLSTVMLSDRVELLCTILLQEVEIMLLEKRIQARVKEHVEKNQREFYLREQIKSIQEELGDTDSQEIEELHQRLKDTPMNDEARQKVEKELDRLSHMTPGTPEIVITRTYLDWLFDMPWGKYTKDNLDLTSAREALNKNHYGMEKVKERIIEYLAVLGQKKNMRGPILCFTGPPGVGKTSIVKSISEAVGRKYIQMSLGGVSDEAEIRGHRRTYVSALPGRIINGIKQAGTMNPVFLFDEIDKMSSDFRGDPASAMLEVLDGEQNHSFRDHYLEVPFDLSKVMFITTSNTIESIPAPLLDRMEIIEVSSYTGAEKLNIAQKHLLPKQIREHGLDKKAIKISNANMNSIVEDYTREAGVRSLERTITKVLRKSIVEMQDSNIKSLSITKKRIHDYLGTARYMREVHDKKPQIGIVNGLAYTAVGGETLAVECVVVPGTGKFHLTGKLGDVMKESAETALSWIRANAKKYKLPEDFHSKNDFHIHVPEGAVPKDGPSAGITITVALLSALSKKPVRQDLAMTGEISLRGNTMPIGGLKEKLYAAYRENLKTVLIPNENKKDLEEISTEITSNLNIKLVKTIDEVLNEVFI